MNKLVAVKNVFTRIVKDLFIPNFEGEKIITLVFFFYEKSVSTQFIYLIFIPLTYLSNLKPILLF